jgi:hypothetical protein
MVAHHKTHASLVSQYYADQLMFTCIWQLHHLLFHLCIVDVLLRCEGSALEVPDSLISRISSQQVSTDIDGVVNFAPPHLAHSIPTAAQRGHKIQNLIKVLLACHLILKVDLPDGIHAIWNAFCLIMQRRHRVCVEKFTTVTDVTVRFLACVCVPVSCTEPWQQQPSGGPTSSRTRWVLLAKRSHKSESRVASLAGPAVNLPHKVDESLSLSMRYCRGP